jgi:hypothetical protein
VNEVIAAAALLYREAQAKALRVAEQKATAWAEHDRLEQEWEMAQRAARDAERTLLAIAKGETNGV